MKHGESNTESVEDHLSSNVHLSNELWTFVNACHVRVLILNVVVTRKRCIVQNLARLAPGSDEQEIVDSIGTQTGLVQIQGHVGKRGVNECQNDEL